MQSMTRVAIIGSAGRGPEAKWITKDRFNKMIDLAKHQITNVFKLDSKAVTLVSGGSSFSDHVAVKLFLQKDFPSLALYLPFEFNTTLKRFAGSGSGASNNSGSYYLNSLHQDFSRAIGGISSNNKSLEELATVIKIPGISVDNSYHGFHSRNTAVATKCDYMIAFSPTPRGPATKSGTGDTWNKCKLPMSKRIHFDLTKL